MNISSAQIRKLEKLFPDEYRIKFKEIFSTAYQAQNVTQRCHMAATSTSGIVNVYFVPKKKEENSEMIKIGNIRIVKQEVYNVDSRFKITFKDGHLQVSRYTFE